MGLEIRPAMLLDIERLAPIVRECDAAELRASSHLTPREALTEGLRISDRAWSMDIDGKLTCIFGVAPIAPGYIACGVAWMIGSQRIEAHKKAFFAGSKTGVQLMLNLYPILCNYVDARHLKALQWLEHLGAQIRDPVPYGFDNLPFRYFEITR